MSAEFIRAIRDAGIPFDADITADGALHRVHVDGDKAGSKNAWYVCFGSAGAFGCNKRAVSGKWRANSKREPLTQQARAEMEAERKARAEAQERAYIDAASRAERILQAAKREASQHPYCVRKGIRPHGVKANEHGWLVIPSYSAMTGKLQTVQLIDRHGNKKMLTGGRMKEGCFPFQDCPEFWQNALHRIGLAEGIATTSTLAESLPTVAMFAAFSAGNLGSVATALRARYPAAEITIYGDNDASGTGQRYATAAATAVCGLIAIPPIPGHDWNDFLMRGAA